MATNMGHYSQLFTPESVQESFLPFFFKFCFDPVSKVAETAALSLGQMLDSID
jgi:hypothetical protein